MKRSILACLIASSATAACGGAAPMEPAAPLRSARTMINARGSMERLESFGLGEVRGIAYMPGPKKAGPTDAAGYELDAKYTGFYDSDFADAAFSSLWGKGDGRGRDDLRRFRDELHVNFVTLYDWSAGVRVGTSVRLRDHGPFLDYVAQLGLKVSLPFSNYQLDLFRDGDAATAKANIRRELEEVYSGTTPHKALGMIKVYNEPDNKGLAPAVWGSIVAETLVTIEKWEDERGVPDSGRLPIFVPVTFSESHGRMAAGAIVDVYQAVMGRAELGARFWRERMIIAVNPFNDGPFMKRWMSEDLPKFMAEHQMPADTPVIFTEYGRSVTESAPATEEGQARWLDGQFSAIFPPPQGSHVVGASAFMSQVRPWISGHDYGYGIMNFGGDTGGWNLPAADFDVKFKYWNPNALDGAGQIWDGAYHVQRQTPNAAYRIVAGHYAR